jgi:hypothetical protein
MQLMSIEQLRRVISTAVTPRRHTSMESSKAGVQKVTTLSRPGFAELSRIAHANPMVLVGALPLLESHAERLVIYEALSEVESSVIAGFWVGAIETETDDEILACAAIAYARSGSASNLEKVEARITPASSARLLYHLGVARLRLDDPRGVDHLLEAMRLSQVPNTSDGTPHGPTLQFIIASMLQQILPKGPGSNVGEWAAWWKERRSQYTWVNGTVLSTGQLAYMPDISAFKIEP